MRASGRRASKLWEIADRDGFKRLMAQVGHSAQRTIPQPTVSRWTNNPPRRLSEKNYSLLFDALFEFNPALLHELDTVVVGPAARDLTLYHSDWQTERARRWLCRSGPTFVFDANQLREFEPADRQRMKGQALQDIDEMLFGDLNALEQYRYLRFIELLEAVMERCPEPVKKLYETCNARGIDSPRALLSVVRILEPLLEAPESAFIERQWQELDDDQLRRFVDAGVRRELILLDRDPDEQRASAVVRHPGPVGMHATDERRTASEKQRQEKKLHRSQPRRKQ